MEDIEAVESILLKGIEEILLRKQTKVFKNMECPFGILSFKHYHQKSWKVFTLSVIIFYSIYGIYNGWYHLIWWISTLLTFKVKFQIFLLLSFLKEIIHLYIISLSYSNISLSIKCKVHLYFYIEKMFAHRTILMELFLLF